MQEQMQKQRTGRLANRTIGLLFLVPGLAWGIPSLIAGTFTGAAMGFCTFAVLFGAFLLFVPDR
jgi:hypothetical protein